MGRFERFRFRFRRFVFGKGFFCFNIGLTERHDSGSSFGFRKKVPTVPVPTSVPEKTVPTVPVSGFGSVPEPPCENKTISELPRTKIVCTLSIKGVGQKNIETGSLGSRHGTPRALRGIVAKFLIAQNSGCPEPLTIQPK